MKLVAVEEPMTNWLLAAPATGFTASVAHGEEEEMPTLPVLVIAKSEVVATPALDEEMLKRVVAEPVATCIEKVAYGEVVPMPIRLSLVTMKLVWVEEPTTNCGMPAGRPLGLMERRPHGEVVPTPTLPVLVIENNVVVPVLEVEAIEKSVEKLVVEAA